MEMQHIEMSKTPQLEFFFLLNFRIVYKMI